MRSKLLVRFVAVLALAALAVPVVAKPIQRDLSLSRAAKFGKVEVQAGDYRMLVDGNKVTLKKDNKVIAELEGTWEQREEKARYASVLIDRSGQIQEVRFANDNRVLVLRSQ